MIHLTNSDELTEMSITEDDGYLLISFLDDKDDALSQTQTIRIHPTDMPIFADLVYEAAMLSLGNNSR